MYQLTDWELYKKKNILQTKSFSVPKYVFMVCSELYI